QGVEQNAGVGHGLVGQEALPGSPRPQGYVDQVGWTGGEESFLEQGEKLADATGLDRLDLQPGEPHLQPVRQLGELFAILRIVGDHGARGGEDDGGSGGRSTIIVALRGGRSVLRGMRYILRSGLSALGCLLSALYFRFAVVLGFQVAGGLVYPELGVGAEEQGVLEALGLEVLEQILVRAQAAGAAVQAAVPLVEDEGKGP